MLTFTNSFKSSSTKNNLKIVVKNHANNLH